LFSLFIEHVSLFSQFLIMMAFNKHKNLFKGISNAVEATSKEEQIHGLFGIDLINLIKEEHPEWFDEKHEEYVIQMCKDAFESESKIIDWIFEAGELDFMSKEVVLEFIKNRFNNSLDSIGLPRIFEIDEKLLEETEWFDDEVIGTKHGDFFVKRSINYNKKNVSITADDLF
jgi:ribonucleoside-diphosphate reductase beta chain